MKIQKRSEKLAFMGIKGSGEEITYKRMTGFTELEKSMNPVEYSRKYVDEDTERSDVTGYSPEISYNMDVDADSEISTAIQQIHDDELTGSAAHVEILIVNLAQETTENAGGFAAVLRTYSVIPDSEGGDDALTLSGSFKANGEFVKGTATTTDEWKSCTFVASED